MDAASRTTEKDSIRREMRRRLRRVDSASREAASASVSKAILALPAAESVLRTAGTVAAYLAMPDEISVDGAIGAFLGSGASVAVPRWNGGGYVLSRIRSLSGFSAGPMGVREPGSVDEVPSGDVRLWIVPGLAFTRDGARLGRGGGWYDRLLAGAVPDSFKVGAAYPFQIVDSIPLEDHDMRLSAVAEGEM